MRTKERNRNKSLATVNYSTLLGSISELLEQGRRKSARTLNAILTATYWEVGRRIIEYEQNGRDRSEYGLNLLPRLSSDLSAQFRKGFSVDNLESMRLFYKAYNKATISETVSRNLTVGDLIDRFPLPWSHYVMLVRRVKEGQVRKFYESESLRNGWSVRQLDRQIATQFYERTALSKNKASMLQKGERSQAGEIVTAEEEIKDPYVLEFLGLKDEYSESDLEEALIQHLERFLLELGGDFAFIGRQKRLRIGSEWYRIDLLFFHRKLRCLVVIDLKIGKFTHADAGQMHLYLNYVRKNWTHKEENPPVGLILCAEKDSAVAKYALEGLPNKILASEYKLILPNEKQLVNEMKATKKKLIADKTR